MRKLCFSIMICCMLGVCITGCSGNRELSEQNQEVFLAAEDLSLCPYESLWQELFDRVCVNDNQYRFSDLKSGCILETYEASIGQKPQRTSWNWQPCYLATVVIAVDSSRLEKIPLGWNDLLETGGTVKLLPNSQNLQYLLGAVSYGLEHEVEIADRTIDFFAELNQEQRFVKEDRSADIWICFDHQAAAWQKDNPAVQIIIPEEGTLTYTKGLLADQEVQWDFERFLRTSYDLGYRQLDGSYCYEIAAGDYGLAKYADETTEFGDSFFLSYKEFCNRVVGSFYCMGDNVAENNLFACLFVLLVIGWLGKIAMKTMSGEVKRVSFFCGTMLAAWGIIRFAKYQMVEYSDLNRYLWFCYYIFMLLIPQAMLWMTCRLGDGMKGWKKYLFRICSIMDSICLVMVFTNDWHNFVFQYVMEEWLLDGKYIYGTGYWLIFVFLFFKTVMIVFFLTERIWHHGKRKSLLLPVGILLVGFLYSIGYNRNIRWFKMTDMTLIMGGMFLLFLEIGIRNGMIHANSHYKRIFEQSSLNMQISDREGTVVFSSSVDDNNREDEAGKDYMVYSSEIKGGTVTWKEDISRISQIERALSENGERLAAANKVLLEESLSKEQYEKAYAQECIMKEINKELEEKRNQLSELVRQLPDGKVELRMLCRIMLMFCYIKRYCSLFFSRKQNDRLDIRELQNYIEEQIEFAEYADIKGICIAELDEMISGNHALVMYSFLAEVLEWMVEEHKSVLIGRIFREEAVHFQIMISGNYQRVPFSGKMEKKLEQIGGRIEEKNLEDSFVIGLKLPKEE